MTEHPSEYVEADAQQSNPSVTEANDARPRLLFFHDPASGPSRRVDEFLSQVLRRHGNHKWFRISRIAIGDRPDLVERLRIDATPTILVIHEGRVQCRIVRARGRAAIAEALRPWLPKHYGATNSSRERERTALSF